jgi:enterochelin esterase family protein
MKILLVGGLTLLCAASQACAQESPSNSGEARRAERRRDGFPTHRHPEVRYEYGPDSQRKEGVPQGKVTEFVWKDSQVFPGTIRRCAIYVPSQYSPDQSAALMVFQDGVRHYLTEDQDFRVPIVFDNLIAAKEMPVTIGIFLDPGYKRDALPEGREARSTAENRSFEYDTLSSQYSEFLLTEILPHVEKEYNVRITDDPAGRAICGMSSGGICAWTVAWERPDRFGKVVSHVGSFTNIRGGNAYPDMIREAESKPIRVILQDGQSDNRNRNSERNWVIANHRMAAALEEKDYDYKFVYGEGAHNGNHGGAILPDTMRWLWRDYPK